MNELWYGNNLAYHTESDTDSGLVTPYGNIELGQHGTELLPEPMLVNH